MTQIYHNTLNFGAIKGYSTENLVKNCIVIFFFKNDMNKDQNNRKKYDIVLYVVKKSWKNKKNSDFVALYLVKIPW